MLCKPCFQNKFLCYQVVYYVMYLTAPILTKLKLFYMQYYHLSPHLLYVNDSIKYPARMPALD